MSNPSLPPEDKNTASAPSSPWVMLISMLLLISGLILSSAMLVHYTMDKNGESIFDFAKLKEKGKELSEKIQAAKTRETAGNEPQTLVDSKSTDPEPSDSAIKKFFSGGKDGSVRWPKLKLTGFGIPANSEVGFAIINGRHITVGGTVNGATLAEILEHGVLVEYKGERKIIIVEVTD